MVSHLLILSDDAIHDVRKDALWRRRAVRCSSRKYYGFAARAPAVIAEGSDFRCRLRHWRVPCSQLADVGPASRSESADGAVVAEALDSARGSSRPRDAVAAVALGVAAAFRRFATLLFGRRRRAVVATVAAALGGLLQLLRGCLTLRIARGAVAASLPALAAGALGCWSCVIAACR